MKFTLVIGTVLLLAAVASAATLRNLQEAKEFVKDQVQNNEVVVFSKTYCGFCRRAKDALEDAEATNAIIHELNTRDDGSLIQDALQALYGSRTVPQVFIGREHIGGSSDTVALHSAGLLDDKVEAAAHVFGTFGSKGQE
eukprot:GFYU01004600.1.p1 GENE.GFYU01004600.1~~GFYU01004600.1.p1  ORF type:complete len:163 (+),score=50.07 GFYU01004600.1:71-490(+)